MILTVSEPRFYTEFTTTKALQALGKKKGVGCRTIWLDDFKDGRGSSLRVDEEITLAVFHAAHIKIARLTIADIKRWLPNAKIVTLGSDSIYYTRRYPDAHHGLLVDPRGYEFVKPEDVSLHLDLLSEVVDVMGKVCPTDRWMWTASDAGLDLADEVACDTINPEKQADVICYANPRVSAPGNYRPRLSQELAIRGRRIQWGGTTEFVTLDEEVLKEIYRLYRRAKVCLGTTSPSWTPCRTMKGWRDWFAPALGVPLIYDDHPDMMTGCLATDFVPPPLAFFPYEDWDALEGLLGGLEKEGEKEALAARQAAWARENTIERQFERLFDHYRLW